MEKTANGYFAYSRRVWGALLLSLPLDLLAIPFLGKVTIVEESAFAPFDLITLCCALVVTFASRLESPSVIFESVRAFRSKSKFIYLCSAILVSLALVGMIHAFAPVIWRMLSAGNYVVVIAVSAFLIMGLFGTLKEQFKILKTRSNLMKLDKTSIDSAHREILFIALFPMVIARMISTVGVLRTYLTGGSPITLISFSLISLILLIASEPKKTHFIGTCKNCFGAVSVSITHVGVCPSCAARAIKHNAARSSVVK